jgi:hypothetical protein
VGINDEPVEQVKYKKRSNGVTKKRKFVIDNTCHLQMTKGKNDILICFKKTVDKGFALIQLHY